MPNMTRNEAISLSCKIKENPNDPSYDFSGILYSAVGMIKLSPDAGTTFAAQLLVNAIKETGRPLSDFCQRRIKIIEEAETKKAIKRLETLAKAYEIADINAERRLMEQMAYEDEIDGYLD